MSLRNLSLLYRGLSVNVCLLSNWTSSFLLVDGVSVLSFTSLTLCLCGQNQGEEKGSKSVLRSFFFFGHRPTLFCPLVFSSLTNGR